MDIDKIRKKLLTPKCLIMIFGSIVGLCLIYGIILRWFFGEWDNSGVFGDSFGGINSLFSGLAFAGIIITILIQSEELKLQREMLEEQKNEMNRFADAVENSERELAEQADHLKLGTNIDGKAALIQGYTSQINQIDFSKMVDREKVLERQKLGRLIENLCREIETLSSPPS